MKKLFALIAWALLQGSMIGAEPASLSPPKYLGAPQPAHAVTNRAFQGIPSMAVAPSGRLWATWYAGVTPGEDHNNYVVLSTSADNGQTWNEVLIVDPDGGDGVRAFDPELWFSPDGRLWMFWAQMEKARRDTQLGVWCITTDEPDREQPKWTAPRRIGDGVMMCKPLTLATGEWALPISKWREHDQSVQMVVSTDQGKSWQVRGGCNVPVDARMYDEHMFIERRDGSLWVLVRTKYGIGESISTDRGRTWPELKPTAIAHTSSRFFVRRLASGNLLLVKHGPIAEKTGRSHLTAYLSTDDGKTWSGGLLLDERTGVSYPDGQQTPDGLIRVIYDFSRTGERQILLATFREEDVAAGKTTSDAVRLRQLVSQASGGQEKKPKATATKQPTASDAVPAEPLRTKQPGLLQSEDATKAELKLQAKLFTDRDYTCAASPDSLPAVQFLRIAMNGSKTITCQRAGTVWFLTPLPHRNRDSQSTALLQQGFKPVALPEVSLFGPRTDANRCTLYQKDCQLGEKIVIDKWAVPVFLP